MRDFARSDHAGVQAALDRLAALSLPQGRMGLETMAALLARLGDPHHRLPPTFHVAGTNGKGSTCAFLRAMLEAHGHTVHVTTSPHLVRYNERIRIAGRLIEDDRLASVLNEVLDAAEGLGASFFEVTIAAAFLEFARVPADACVVEVGMGGRFDATNVLPPHVLAACGIAALGIDHKRFLLAPEVGVPVDPMERIAFEKAGIAKPGVPLVVQEQPDRLAEVIGDVAAKAGAPLLLAERDWRVMAIEHEALMLWSDAVRPGEGETWRLDLPLLRGGHQTQNAGLAIAMLRAQRVVPVMALGVCAGLAAVSWPARLQRLAPGPVCGRREVWLDGGHNHSAGAALAAHFAAQRLHLIIGMIEGKDPQALLAPLGNIIASITAVPVLGHDSHAPETFGSAAVAADDVEAAVSHLPDDGLPVLIAGSLYLAGDVLRRNGEMPD